MKLSLTATRYGLSGAILLLSGCVVTDMDSSNYAYVPWIQVFQKPDASGRTNVSQRKEDLYACGVRREDNLDDKNWGLNNAYENETPKEHRDRMDNTLNCMTQKGYKVYGFDECGPLKKPTGLCPN